MLLEYVRIIEPFTLPLDGVIKNEETLSLGCVHKLFSTINYLKKYIARKFVFKDYLIVRCESLSLAKITGLYSRIGEIFKHVHIRRVSISYPIFKTVWVDESEKHQL